MAAAWVKSLQCKSRAFDDVIHPSPKQPFISPALGNTASCRNSFQGLKDVIPSKSHPKPVTKSKQVKTKHKPKSEPPPLKPVKRRPQSAPQQSQVRRQQHSLHSESSTTTTTQSIKQTTTSASIRPVIHRDPFFPSLSELQEGHPSRNVVEIIFQTRWSSIKPFPGQVEMVFKIHNLPKTVTRFEEYRETVKIRADSEVVDDGDNNNNSATTGSGRKHNKQYCSEESIVRCVADGNEMMRFHCLGPTTGVIDAGAGGICAINAAGKVGGGVNNNEKTVATSICTFDGSGTAHDNAGGGRGRRAMLVCRVIAGRVKKRRAGMGMGMGRVALTGGGSGFESVAGENGELLVFDSRAVLPCFLVIYRL